MNKLTKYLLIITLLLSSFLATAISGNNWEVYYENTQVKISFRHLQCDFQDQFDQEYVVFKIENLSSQAITVQWDTKMWYDNSCVNCEQDFQEYRKIITLEAEEIMQGNCDENKTFQLFSKFTEKLKDMPGLTEIKELTKFELENLIIFTNE